MAEHPLEDLLARLERERLEADRLYNEALTAVDRAIQQAPDLNPPEPAYDESLLPRLEQEATVLSGGPPSVDRSLKGRLREFVWRLVAPPFDRQQRFNQAVVDHLKRNAGAQRQAREGAARLLERVRHEFDALIRFESLLVQYLQTVTMYVDTKDRRWGGRELWERLGLAEQRLLALKRDVDERQSRGPQPSGAEPGRAVEGSRLDQRMSPPAFAGHLESATYVGFEDRFRGSREEIRGRVADYLPLFVSASDVIDVGCGRGELLDLLGQQGITARGVDGNYAMVQVCRERGLHVEQGDALAFLERQKDGALGGLAAIQVVEHFEPQYLLRFLEVAQHKLRPGAPLVLETINPACWLAFFECYLRDVTHRQALHPDTLRYLVQASGFGHVDVRYRQPLGDADRLAHVPEDDEGNLDQARGRLAAVVSTVNAHADKLNAHLFSSMDYAVIARR